MKNLNNFRGMALIIVMWLLVLMVVLASELVVSARSDLGAVHNFTEDRQAYFLAKAGIQMAANEIMGDSNYHYYYEEGQIRFAKAGDDDNPPKFSPRIDIPLGDGLVSYEIADENAKLNINRLARNPVKLRLLLSIVFTDGFENLDTIVDSIADWVDADDLHRVSGAEDEYYGSLTSPYHAKNADFYILSELKKVKGITENIYRALEPHLTVHAAGNINKNTASIVALTAMGLPESDILKILDAREEKGYFDTVSASNVFTVRSTGRFGDGPLVHTIKAVLLKTGGRSVRFLDWQDDFYIP